MADLSVLIPARCEEFLKRTVEDVLAHAKGSTEIIVVLDGEWADPPLDEHPQVQVIYLPWAIGQRAATNLAARISTAKYVMKLDAHCSVDDGFDVKLIEAGEALGHDVTQIPRQYNLHIYNWKCLGCGTEIYHGPEPTACKACSAKGTPGGPFERVIYWDRNAGGVNGKHVRSDYWCVDHTLHFAYFHEFGKRPEAKGQIVDVMSSLGACFFMRRERFHELGGLDEAVGSWGQFGQEIAFKSWLSGGRQVVNKNTWFAHFFRVGGIGFPYDIKGSDQDKARVYSRNLWLNDAWQQQVRPVSWLVEKFAPLPGWHKREGAEALAEVRASGKSFTIRESDERRTGEVDSDSVGVVAFSDRASVISQVTVVNQSKGIVYYSDLKPNPELLSAVRKQLYKAAQGLPISAVTLGWLSSEEVYEIYRRGGMAIAMRAERGYLTMFRQILTGLEALKTDVAYLCEHDCLYAPDHFQFTPPSDLVYYYSLSFWKVDAKTGHAVTYRAKQTSGLCANRKLLVKHYRERIRRVEAEGFTRAMGFEPGSHGRKERIDDIPSDVFLSAVPNIDVRHCCNLTPSRWKIEDFRDKRNCQDWQEGSEVPGWGLTEGRFQEFLANLSRVEVPV